MTVARSTLLLLASLSSWAPAGCAPVEPEPLPAAPSISPPTTPTAEPRQVLRGTKPPSTGIELNDLLAVELDETGVWEVEVSLEDGPNGFRVVAIDPRGRRSTGVSTTIFLDRAAPPPPLVDAPDYPTLLEVWPLSGHAAPANDVIVNGDVAQRRDDDGAFREDVALRLGDNEVRVTAADPLGNESAPSVVVLTRTTFLFSLDPPPALLPSSSLTLTGERGGGVDVKVNGVTRVPRTSTGGPFSLEVALAPGENTLEVRGVHPDGVSDGATYVVVSDVDKPPAPILGALPPALVTGSSVTLTGTRADDAALVVDGVVLAPRDGTTAFSVEVPLPLGTSVLDVRARDDAGNVSAAVTPAPSFYRDPNGIHFVLDPVPAQVATATLILGGAKAGNAVVRVGGALAAAGDGATTWSHPVTLAPGPNTVVIAAEVGPASRTLSVDVEYLPNGPGAATVTLPRYVKDPLLLVDGVKPAGTGVVRADGSPVAPLDDNTTFHDELTLSSGDNPLAWRTRDPFGRLGPTVGGTVVLDQTGPVITVEEPADGEAVGVLFDLSGTATDDGALASVELCLGDACSTTGTWQSATLTGGAFDALVSTLSLDPLLDGTLVELHVRASDEAGNVTALAPRAVLLVREPLAASADATFAEPSQELDLAVGPAGEVDVVFDHPGPSGGDVYLLREDTGSFSGLDATLLSAPSFGASASPRVARDAAGVAYVAWLADGTTGSATPGSPGVVIVSVDAGLVSSPDVLEATGGCDALDVAASPGGLVAVSWRREIAPASFALELTVHDGAAWGAPSVIAADGDGVSAQPTAPSLAFGDDETLHIVWQDAGSRDGSADDADVLYRRWSESTGLEATVLVSQTGGDLVDGVSRDPRVAAVPGSVTRAAWVGWVETGAILSQGSGREKAAVRRVSDAGLGPVREASSVTGSALVRSVDVAVSGSGELVVVWADAGPILSSGSDDDVFLRASPSVFKDVVAISDSEQDQRSTGSSALPRVAVDAIGNAHVVWLEASDLTGTLADASDVDVLYFVLGENQR